MSGFARVVIVGNVGKDPECSITKNGKEQAKFSIATSRGKNERTHWHNVTCWGQPAEIVRQYVTKGRQVCVEGDLEYSESEHNGVKRYWTNILAFRVHLLGSRSDRGDSTDERADQAMVGQTNQDSVRPTDMADEDVPF